MTKASKNNPVLSIVVLYYNSKDYLEKCLDSLALSKLGSYKIETIIVNNGATDGIAQMNEQKFKNNSILNTKFVYSPTNLGFAAGNNLGIKHLDQNSKYVLFVNDDMIFNSDTVSLMIDFFEKNNNVDASTCYVILSKTNQLALETHRGFPTPWNTFWHFFGLGIPTLFPKSKLLHGYLGDYKEYTKTQQIDCCQGCFLMLKKTVGEKIKWWNEKYFFLGEDLDLCYKLKQNKFSLYFYPKAKIIHFHGISSGLKNNSASMASRETKIRSALASTTAMKIFYQENLMSQYPSFFHPIIYLGINLLKFYRVFKAKYL
ncbi:MAG: glycosyltransferase family 2 protein [Candidatus Shapirobacteria bacterium]